MMSGRVRGDPVQLRVVEEHVAGRGAQARLRLRQRNVDVVGRVVLQQVAAVHFGARLQDDELQGRAEVVDRRRGAGEHGDGVGEFELNVFVRFVCWD